MSLDDVQQVDYLFDRANRLQKITDSTDSTFIDYNYDAADQLTRKILPNGISTIYQYDGMSRLTRLRDFKTNPDTTEINLYNRGYDYDQASNSNKIVPKILNEIIDRETVLPLDQETGLSIRFLPGSLSSQARHDDPHTCSRCGKGSYGWHPAYWLPAGVDYRFRARDDL